MSTARVLRKTGKILLITIAGLIVFVLALAITALNTETTITRLALDEVSEMFDAPVKVDNVDLLLLRNFPYATVEFDGFQLGNAYDSTKQQKGDTLLSLRKLFVSVKTRPLLSNKIEIEKVEIEGFAFNYNVDADGKTNLDFLLESSDTTEIDTLAQNTTATDSASPLDVLLSNLTIRDVTVNFVDNSMKATAKVHIPEMDISGRVLDEYYAGSVKGEVILTNTSFDNTNLNRMNKSSLGFFVDYDDGNVEIKSVDFLTDGAKLAVKGKAKLGDSIFVDMGVDLTQVDIKELSKYAPEEIMKEYGLLTAEGRIDINTQIKGYVFDTILLPQIETNIKMNDIAVKTRDYPELKHFSCNGVVKVPNPNDMTTMSASFSSLKIATEQSTIDLAFDVENFEKPRYKLNSKIGVTLDEFVSFIPDSTVEYLSGKINLDLSTHGVLPDDLGMNSADYFLDRTSIKLQLRDISTALDSVTEVKNLSADFSYKPNRYITLTGVKVEAPGYGVTVDNLTIMAKLLGKVRDMDNMGVQLDTLSLDLGNTTLDMRARVEGLKKPTFEIDTRLNIDIDQWLAYVPDSLVEKITGDVSLALKSHGTVDLDSVDTQIMPIAFENSDVKLQVKNFSFAMVDDPIAAVNDLNLKFAMANDTIRVDDMSLNAQGIDVRIDSTEVWNVYKAMLLEQSDQTIIVQTHVKIGDVDYGKLEPLFASDTTNVDSTAVATLEGSVDVPSDASETVRPANQTEVAESVALEEDTSATEEAYMPHFIARGSFAVNSAKYEEFFIEDISGMFRVDDSLYVIDQFKLKAFGGEMNTSAVYDTRIDTATIISFKNVIKGMDIHQLLIDGNNFDQEDFTHENISGMLTSEFDGRIVMNGDSVLYEKINIMGDFKLENGGLYNYEPVVELSKTPVPGLNDLDSIVFNTMESSVFIYKNNIYFPKTDIVSTALDISAYGMQSFDEDYEYHLIVHFGDVLWGKSEKLLKEQGYDSDVFEGSDEADRKGTALIAMDREGKTKYGPDNKSLRRMMSTKIRLMKTGLSFIFHPRLVNFSTDLDRKENVTRPEE